MTDELRIGRNRLMLDGDLVHVVENREWNVPDMEAILALFERLRAQHGRAYVLAEATGSPNISPDARRTFAEWSRQHSIDTVAIYGANLATRALLMLVFRAAELTSGVKLSTHMVATEAEGRRQIARHRARGS